MFATLAPYASTPPSPNSKAWKSNATATAIIAAHGPSTIAITPAPTACAVVPSGIGMLNIITRKLTAENIASVGTCRVLTTFFTLRTATSSAGTATA